MATPQEQQPQQGQPQAQGQAPAPTGGGLPPTGLQQQLSAVQSRNAQATGMGIDPTQMQFGQAQQAGGAGGVGLQGQGGAQGSNSLQQLASKLASSYGLSVGRGELFDESGNPLVTPEQISQASGGSETMGTAAAKMGYIADAIARQQTMDAQGKAQDTLQAGIGMVQSRARGSLAAMQSGMYQQMSAQYANQEYEGADFSFYIQREQQQIEQALQHRARKQAKKNAIGGVIMGAIGLAAAPFTGGATLPIAAQGLGQLGATGWV